MFTISIKIEREFILLLQPLKIVGFYGDGYLEHSAYTLRKIHSVLSFSFRTMQDAAMLLLSTFEGHEDSLNDNLKETEKVRVNLIKSLL